MSGLIQSLGIASRLAEIHELTSRLYGKQFAGRVAEFEPLLRATAEQHDGNLLAAATELTKDDSQDRRLTLLILAVAVELTKRDKAEMAEMGKGNAA